MNYHSHVLYFPNKKPFDHHAFRWTSFVGEFIVPLMKNRTDLYWFSYYGDCARFRLYTAHYSKYQRKLEQLLSALGLEDKGEEKDLTLVGDLGHSCFVAPNSQSNPEKRSLLVLHYLNSICRLFEDNLIRNSDNYWETEKSDSGENPLGNNFESLAHLLANISHFQFDVELAYRTIWMPPQLIGRVRCRL